MAKKIPLPASDNVGDILDDAGTIKIGPVKYTPDSARNPNIQSRRGGQDQSVFPVVDTHCLEAQDANDGTSDGDQSHFDMPSFADGRDMRVGR